MYYVLADGLAEWGQIAAIVILLYMFVLIVVGLVLALALWLGLTWVRQKVELIKKLRPTVDSVNTASEAALKGLPPSSQYAGDDTKDKIVRSAVQIPIYAHTAEQKVEQGSDRVAEVVIEFRARTEMAKGILKALFLPGLTPRPKTVLEEEGIGFRSPGYKMLIDEKIPTTSEVEYGTSYTTGNIRASELKDAPVAVSVTTPKELQNIPNMADQRKDAAIH